MRSWINHSGEVVWEPAPSLIAQLIEAGQPFWLDIENPTDETIDQLATRLGLHPLAVEDSKQFGQRAKLQVYKNGVMLVGRLHRDRGAMCRPAGPARLARKQAPSGGEPPARGRGHHFPAHFLPGRLLGTELRRAHRQHRKGVAGVPGPRRGTERGLRCGDCLLAQPSQLEVTLMSACPANVPNGTCTRWYA